MRTWHRSVILLSAFSLLAASLSAQAVLRPGSTARGELKSGDLKLDDDTYADLWRFTGSAGQSVTITMRSSAFDAYLVVGYYDEAGNFKDLKSDDDGAGGTNSRVSLRLPRDGEYIARANTLAKGETGGYTLDLDAGSEPSTATAKGKPRAYPVIVVGQVVRGDLERSDEVLADGSYADTYRFAGLAGQRVSITLKSSDFDAYLSLGRDDNGSYREIKADDDSGEGTDASLDVILPATGEYLVRANTLTEGETGAYVLQVRGSGGDDRAMGSGDSLVSVRPGARMPLVLGQLLRGTLEDGDEKLSDDSPADIWVYQGRKGETLTMIQRSTVHNAYLTAGPVTNGRWVWTDSNDNDAGGNDAKLVVTLKADGEYWVRPNAHNKGTGAYTLFVTSDRAPSAVATSAQPASSAGQAQPAMPAVGPLQQGLTPGASNSAAPAPAQPAAQPVPRPSSGNRPSIQVGQTVRGELSTSDEFNFDSTYVDTYVIAGRRGQQLNILMLSPSFGSYVLFGRVPAPGAAFSSIETKGAVRGAEAKLVVTLPEDGDFWIRANSFEKTTGSYVLTVEAGR